MRRGRTFRSGRTRPADGQSNNSEILSRIQSLADYTIDTLESSFQKRQRQEDLPAGLEGAEALHSDRAAAESVRTSGVGARPTRPRSARQRPAGFLPAVEAALDVAGRGEARVLRRLHRHGRALAEGAVEQEPLAGRFASAPFRLEGADLRRRMPRSEISWLCCSARCVVLIA